MLVLRGIATCFCNKTKVWQLIVLIRATVPELCRFLVQGRSNESCFVNLIATNELPVAYHGG